MLLKDWAKEGILEMKKVMYDPEQRKERYLQQKRKNQDQGVDQVCNTFHLKL